MRIFRQRSLFISLFKSFRTPGVSRLNDIRYLFKKVNNFNTGLFLFSLSFFTNYETVEEHTSKEKIKQYISVADDLYKQHKYREIYNLLVDFKESTEVELLWRLSRAMYNLSEETSISTEEKKYLIFDAYSIIERSLQLDGKHYANHKWMSILLDTRSSYDGIKARIINLENVKKHMLAALELNPKDATTLYMLGLWCFQIADMPWVQRRIASTIFAAPPTSTYEEALGYFVKAEEVEPRFYCQNLLMLGKTYLKLGKEDKARYYLDLACNYPHSTDDDRLALKEASELLKRIKHTN